MKKINPWRQVYDHPQSKDPFSNGLPSFALYIDVEPTNSCNMDCLFCARQQMRRPIGFMNMELFEKICLEAKEYGCLGIRFLRWGEPLLNVNIFEMIRMAKKYNLLTHLTTNGLLLKDDSIMELIGSGLDCINISMQGLSGKEYNLLRNTDSFDLLGKNIKHLYKIREENASRNPFLNLAVTITDEASVEIDDFIAHWGSFVDDISIGYTWFKRLKDKTRVDPWLRRARILPHYFRCIEVMCKLSIDWDGTVSVCCLDYDQELTIGNVKNDNLMKIWDDQRANKIRNLLSDKGQDSFVLCSTCELNYDFRGRV